MRLVGNRKLFFLTEKLNQLIATNYYRDLGKFGKFIDYFWLIDLPFIVIFALDILIRTYYMSRPLDPFKLVGSNIATLV